MRRNATIPTSRPYPNVVPTASGRYEARHPRPKAQVHLGTFSTPEGAYKAVLLSQARWHEEKAAQLRQEAREFGEAAI